MEPDEEDQSWLLYCHGKELKFSHQTVITVYAWNEMQEQIKRPSGIEESEGVTQGDGMVGSAGHPEQHLTTGSYYGGWCCALKAAVAERHY